MLNLDKKNRYLLACSFGPDSMYLCNLLLEEGYSFDVAHVNYHLRKESNDEEVQLRKYCEQKNLKLFVLDNKEKIEKNVEARCRDIRYSFFAKLYKENKYSALLVAHHQDDLLETYFLQKKRKNLVTYYGIAPKTVIKDMVVLRPLLDVNKENILQTCKSKNIPFAIDATNLLPMFERNKIRIEQVSKMSEQQRIDLVKEINAKNKELSMLLSNISKCGNSISELKSLSDIEFAYYLNAKVKEISNDFSITYKQSIEVKQILLNKKPNISVFAARNQILIVKAYDELVMKKNDDKTGYSFVIKKPCVIDNEFFFADLTSDTSNRNISYNDYPLTIRTYKQGDEYKIKNYTVKVRRLFIDWKVPVHIRKRWPIIVNKEGKIIYIPRYRKEFRPETETNFFVKECFTLK